VECTLFVVVGDYMRKRNKGFSLLEMAIIVAVVGVLMSGMLELMKLAHTIEMTRTTKLTLEKLVKDAIGYAVINEVLPAKIEDLGSERITDAWGKKIEYKVDPNYRVKITPATQSKFCEIKYSANCTSTNGRDDDLYVAARFRANTPQGEYDSYVSEKELKFYMVSGQTIYP
jgi:competence protein ComGC